MKITKKEFVEQANNIQFFVGSSWDKSLDDVINHLDNTSSQAIEPGKKVEVVNSNNYQFVKKDVTGENSHLSHQPGNRYYKHNNYLIVEDDHCVVVYSK